MTALCVFLKNVVFEQALETWPVDANCLFFNPKSACSVRIFSHRTPCMTGEAHTHTHTPRALLKVYLFGTIFYLSRSFSIHPIITAEIECRWIDKTKRKPEQFLIVWWLLLAIGIETKMSTLSIEFIICASVWFVPSLIVYFFRLFFFLPCVCFCLYSWYATNYKATELDHFLFEWSKPFGYSNIFEMCVLLLSKSHCLC